MGRDYLKYYILVHFNCAHNTSPCWIIKLSYSQSSFAIDFLFCRSSKITELEASVQKQKEAASRLEEERANLIVQVGLFGSHWYLYYIAPINSSRISHTVWNISKLIEWCWDTMRGAFKSTNKCSMVKTSSGRHF